MSRSLFDLTTNVSELSSANQGVSRLSYNQYPPTRDVVGNNWSNGAIHIRWEQSSQRWWVPNRSYLRFRCQLSKADGTQLDLSDGIAPTMGLAASLFQSMEFRLNDKIVSRISDFVPQIDALENRLSKSRAWLNGTGSSTNFWDESFSVRQIDTTSDGTSEKKNDNSRTRVQLGVGATQEIAIAVDTGVLTQSVDTAVSFADIFVEGDHIDVDLAGGGTMRYQVVEVLSANTLQLDNVQTIAVAADVLDWSRVRSEVSKTDEGRHMNTFEITWQPPLSIFKINHALPLGRYEMVLTPQTSSVYQNYVIESELGGGNKVPNTATAGAPSQGAEFLFRIVDFYAYINQVDGPRLDNGTFLLDLEQTRCQSESIDTTSFQQKNFDVSPSTYALTAAYMDLRAGTNSQAAVTKFKSYNAGLDTSEELKLNRLFIQYAGQSIPSPDADPSFVAGEDYTTQRYTESQLYSGAYFSEGSGESIQEWHDRGAYYFFMWNRDGSDRSTRVTVHQQFNGADVANMRLLLFDHSKQVARITITDSRVTNVELEDA